MLINLRNALMAGKKWKNPYNTDGLVAMWDGEWNAGGGKHDASATSIVDFVGGNNLSILGSTTISEYSFTPSNIGTAVYLMTSRKIEQTIRAVKITVADGIGATGANSFGIISLGQNHRGICKFAEWIGCGASGTYLMQQQSVNTGISAWSVNYNSDDTNNANVSFFKNGSPASGATTNWSTTSIQDGTDGDELVRIRGAYSGCAIYNICLYNRALTASEIAANYAIDKERFNLP